MGKCGTTRRRRQMPGTPLPERKSWQALRRHYDDIAGQHLRDLFAGDPGRGERLTAEAAADASMKRFRGETSVG